MIVYILHIKCTKPHNDDVSHRAPDVWKFSRVNLAHVPRHDLGDRVEGILSLVRCERDIQDRLRKGDLYHHVLNLVW